MQAVGKIRNSQAMTALEERVGLALTAMPDDLRERIKTLLFNATPESRRSLYMEFFLKHPRPQGYGDISAMWLKSPSSDANRVSASTLWVWRSDAAPFALASCLGDAVPATAITAAIALSRQERGAVLSVLDKLMVSGDPQERALASAAAYLAGRSQGLEGCRKALRSGSINDTVAAFLAALLAGSGDEDGVKDVRNMLKRARPKTLPALFAQAGLVLAGEAGAADELVNMTADVRPIDSDLLAAYFLFRAGSAGDRGALSAMFSLYSRDSHYTGVFLGAMLAQDKPPGMVEALAPVLKDISPRMTPSLSLAFKSLAQDAYPTLVNVVKTGSPQERKTALYLLADIGVQNEEFKETLAELLKANKDNNEFVVDVRTVARKICGEDIGTAWQDSFKALAPEKYDINDEVLVKMTIGGTMAMLVPTGWDEQGVGRYVAKRLPGDPIIRTGRQEDRNPLNTRRFPSAREMLLNAVSRYTFDMLTRQRIKNVAVEQSKDFSQGAFAVAYTTVMERDGRGRMLACGVLHRQEAGYYVEVEGECDIKYFDRYRPLFEKVIRSMELLVGR